MGWLQEKYTREYFLQRDEQGNLLPFGVYGIEFWERGDIYPEGRILLDQLRLQKARVLDLGFGRGEAIKYCLDHGAKHVDGVDFSESALDLAAYTLRDISPERYQLRQKDIHAFLNEDARPRSYTHVLMLDVIEHIPRTEVGLLLPFILQSLVPGGVLVIHTPFFPQDNDVITQGLLENCKDSSDEFDATRGMHINRYSRTGLGQQLQAHGFKRWGDYLFLRPTNGIPIWEYGGILRGKIGRILGYWVS